MGMINVEVPFRSLGIASNKCLEIQNLLRHPNGLVQPHMTFLRLPRLQEVESFVGAFEKVFPIFHLTFSPIDSNELQEIHSSEHTSYIKLGALGNYLPDTLFFHDTNGSRFGMNPGVSPGRDI